MIEVERPLSVQKSSISVPIFEKSQLCWPHQWTWNIKRIEKWEILRIKFMNRWRRCHATAKHKFGYDQVSNNALVQKLDNFHTEVSSTNDRIRQPTQFLFYCQLRRIFEFRFNKNKREFTFKLKCSKTHSTDMKKTKKKENF